MKVLNNKQLFLDMQEHPEKYTDEQLEAMMAELDREPNAEREWHRLQPASSHMFSKVAAVFLAISVFGMMSLACYRAFSPKHHSQRTIAKADTTHRVKERFSYKVHRGDTIFCFENIRLDSILTVVGKHYRRQVRFRTGAPRQLRFYVTCHTTQSLDEFVEMLNVFDGFFLYQRLDTLVVETGKKEEEKR